MEFLHVKSQLHLYQCFVTPTVLLFNEVVILIPESEKNFLQTSEVEGDLGGVTKNVFVREQIFYLKVKLFDIFDREGIYFSKAYFKFYIAEKPRSLEIRYFGIRRNRITNESLIPL